MKSEREHMHENIPIKGEKKCTETEGKKKKTKNERERKKERESEKGKKQNELRWIMVSKLKARNTGQLGSTLRSKDEKQQAEERKGKPKGFCVQDQEKRNTRTKQGRWFNVALFSLAECPVW